LKSRIFDAFKKVSEKMPESKFYRRLSLSGPLKIRLFALMQNITKLGIELNSAEVFQTLKDLVKKFEETKLEEEKLDRRVMIITDHMKEKILAVKLGYETGIRYDIVDNENTFYLQPVAMIGLKRKEYNLAKNGQLDSVPWFVDFAEYSAEQE